MGLRRWLPLALCAWIACGKGDKSETDTSKPGSSAADDDKRCLTLGKLCGDQSKHVDKIVGECNQAAKKQAEKGCIDKASAAYDCYQRELCGKSDKVWAIDDLGVLAERHGKCVAERNALASCIGK